MWEKNNENITLIWNDLDKEKLKEGNEKEEKKEAKNQIIKCESQTHFLFLIKHHSMKT
jgi:hypothetical protein